MPVKITSGATNNSQGVINRSDLTKMKNNFIKETVLSGKGENTVVKSDFCFLFKEQVDDLFALSPGTNILKINFALHLDPTEECGEDYSNSLTVVIEAADDTEYRLPRVDIDDYVLIPAYANKTDQLRPAAAKANAGNPCCPSQGGGKGG